MKVAGCPLCDAAGGHIVYEADKFRLVRADEEGFPAFYRLIWSDHIPEFSDLSRADRTLCMDAVACVESVLRDELAPVKINLAALGNMVPHLHWHVIARFEWDNRFPAPVWAPAQREVDPSFLAHVRSQQPVVEAALREALARPGNCTPS